MSAPLPDALRARFQRLIEEGLSGRAAALRLKLSPATGARWGRAVRRTGHVRAAPQGRPRGKGKLDPHRAFLIELIDQDGDMTMPELASALADATGVHVHPDAIEHFDLNLNHLTLPEIIDFNALGDEQCFKLKPKRYRSVPAQTWVHV